MALYTNVCPRTACCVSRADRRLPLIVGNLSLGVAMKKKFLVSGLLSIGILVGGFGAAYALSTFKASQEGFRQAGAGQATRLTMRVEAGMADANSDLVPDDYYP